MMMDWTKHLTGDAKTNAEKEIRNSTFVVGRIKELIAEYETELRQIETKMDTYDSPSWACKQAHINGRRQELNRFLKLFTLDP